MDAREFSELANGGVHARCACHDSAARFEIEGREYIGQFDGQISVRLGKPTMSYERLQTIIADVERSFMGNALSGEERRELLGLLDRLRRGAQ